MLLTQKTQKGNEHMVACYTVLELEVTREHSTVLIKTYNIV